MRRYRKEDYPVDQARRFLEPGPVVLLSTAWKGQRNVMPLGWHMVLEFTPSLLGTMISSANHSFALARRSRQCVINLPTVALLDTVVGIGNCSGTQVDKFERFGLETTSASAVAAPLLAHCPASFECRLHDASQINRHGLFIWEIVKAHVAAVPKLPRTLHYRGDGQFMLSGAEVSRRGLFNPGML